MAFLTLLTITLLVTIASAGSPWPDSDGSFPGFNKPMMMLRYAPAPVPRMPSFPPFPMFTQFPFFPTMAPIPFPPLPPIPTPEDIVNASPPNGGTYSGLVVTSQTTSQTNEDGTVSKKTGYTSVINNDGKVIVTKQTGDSPPEIFTKTAPFDFEELKVKHSKLHKFPKSQFAKHFDGFDHHFPSFKPIDRKKIESYVPKEGESFTGHSVHTHRYVNEVNGVKKEGASISKLENDNGLVSKETVAFHQGNKAED